MTMRWLRLCLFTAGLLLVLGSAVWLEARAFGLWADPWSPCAASGAFRGSRPADKPFSPAGPRRRMP